MGVDEGKSGGFSGDQQSQFHYGTFQGVANYQPPYPVQPHYNLPPPPLVAGFPQPVPPPGLSAYSYGYQSVPVVVHGYAAVAEGRPVRDRLPCCGIGFGWFLFIIGFFLGGFPWYIGTFFLLFARVDPREKPGCVACLIGAVLASIAIMFGLTSGHHHHW
uniref:60S ribosomal protein L18a-like protein n=1 Tax=Kalanchoe fedtschenkoi TaxID=63787 RepID=A0A7N0VH66_KALFE